MSIIVQPCRQRQGQAVARAQPARDLVRIAFLRERRRGGVRGICDEVAGNGRKGFVLSR